MAKPSTTFTWATDATFSSGPASGKATTIAPAAGSLAQGFIPGLNYPSQWANYILNLTGEWVNWANTYAAGLELNNTFTGNNIFSSDIAFNGIAYFNNSVAMAGTTISVGGSTFTGAPTFSGVVDFDAQVNTNSILNAGGVAYFNDAVDFFSTAVFADVVDFNARIDVNGELNLESTSYIDSPMTESSDCRVEGSWKVSFNGIPFTYSSGTSGATTVVTNTTDTIANAATSTLWSIAIASDSHFSITLTISSWYGSVTPSSSTYFISGRNLGGSITFSSTALAAHAGGASMAYTIDVSGNLLRVRGTNGSGSSQDYIIMGNCSIQIADTVQ